MSLLLASAGRRQRAAGSHLHERSCRCCLRIATGVSRSEPGKLYNPPRGRCVAGIELLEDGASGGWLRQVSARPGDELTYTDYRFQDGCFSEFIAESSDIKRSTCRLIKLVKLENCEAGNKP